MSVLITEPLRKIYYQSIYINIVKKIDYSLLKIFSIKIGKTKAKVTPLARIIGHDIIIIPYTSQLINPIENNKYIHSEISLVWRVLRVFKACGIKLPVVKIAPMVENKVIASILL
jgi:hypothetical protein